MASSEGDDSRELSLKDLSGQSTVSLGQLHKLLGVTYQTALRYIKTGAIKATRRGGRWIIMETEVRRFLESGNNGMQDPVSQKTVNQYHNTRRDGPPKGFKISDLE